MGCLLTSVRCGSSCSTEVQSNYANNEGCASRVACALVRHRIATTHEMLSCFDVSSLLLLMVGIAMTYDTSSAQTTLAVALSRSLLSFGCIAVHLPLLNSRCDWISESQLSIKISCA